MSVKTFIFFGILGVISLAFIFLGIWTYRDAKSRGLNAGLWTAVVLLVPNLVGLLLYFLVGRRGMMKCPSCSGAVQVGSSFCPSCGQRIPSGDSVIQQNRGGRGLLIGFIICILVLIGIAFGIVKYSQKGNMGLFSSQIAIGMVENKIGNKWNLSFMSLSGDSRRSFRIKEGTPKKIFIKSDIESGSLILHITQEGKGIKINLDNDMGLMEESLEGFEEGKVNLRIEARNAKGGRVNIWWE